MKAEWNSAVVQGYDSSPVSKRPHIAHSTLQARDTFLSDFVNIHSPTLPLFTLGFSAISV